MSSCTFFGHKNTPEQTEKILLTILIDLIENKNVDMFYVGNNGSFDNMVIKNLKILKLDYPHIKYAIVLAYMPNEKAESRYDDLNYTIYPEGLENTPPKYAIVKRNRWMINMSDYVVVYVKHSFGGAAQFKELAEKKGKIVINLADSKALKCK